MRHLMKCGHVAQAIDAKGNPVCAICIGPAARDVERECSGNDGLEGRTARCCYIDCHNSEPSSWELAFFEYRPEKRYDIYYCGCKGWD